jgi:hypothetical protein
VKDLSLHVLDIAQNSIAAGAQTIEIRFAERGRLLTLTVKDDGRGMEPDLLKRAADPFTTTRDTRPVGLGLPFLRMAAELTGGNFSLSSEPGRGTTVRAVFHMDHIDALPPGDLVSSVATIVQGAPGLAVVWTHEKDGGGYTFDTRSLRAVLDGVPLAAPDVLNWIRDHLSEQEAALISSAGEGESDEKP